MASNIQKLLFLEKSVHVLDLIRKWRAKQKENIPKVPKVPKVRTEEWLLQKNKGRNVLNLLQQTDNPHSYKMFIGMIEEHFDELLHLIGGDIAKRDTNMRQCIPPENRLGITLRFLVTGETYRTLMTSSKVHETTISKIIPEVCKTIFENLKNKYLLLPTSEDSWLKISEDFNKYSNFPLCLGAIDGKHINFKHRRLQGSKYQDYDGHPSVFLLAVCDSMHRFVYVDVGLKGSISDAEVYHECGLRNGIDSNLFSFPPNEILPGQDIPTTHVFVADDSFPSSKRIMKPYSNCELTNEKRIFNYRLSKAKRVVENAFDIMANRFRILLTTINLTPDKVEQIVLACVVLHNFLVTKNVSIYTDIDLSKCTKLDSFQKSQDENTGTEDELTIRNSFSAYFNSNGAVPWQNECLS